MPFSSKTEKSFFHFSLFVLVKAKSLEELDEECIELENILGSMRLMFRKCTNNMRNALWSVMPFGANFLGTARNMLTTGIVNSFPFMNYTFSHKNCDKSFFFSIQKHNSTLIHFNPWELINPHFGILGISGSGKGVASKKVLKGLTTILDIPLTYIDIQGETVLKVYDHINHKDTSFAESINATVYDYSVGGKNKLNLLEPLPDPEKDSLIKDMEKVYSLHQFSVALPKSFILIAKSNKCIQAIRKDNLVGVLFHPEVYNKEVIRNFVGL